MINQQFLSQCSDQQIKLGVSWVVASKLSINKLSEVVYTKYSNQVFIGGLCFTPLHNPSDIMPIAFANDISVGPMNSGMHPNHWAAHENKATGVYSYNEKPLRAIAEVYILMNNQEGV